VLALGTLAVGFETLLVGLGPAALVGRGIGEAEAAVLASLFFGCFLAMRFALFWLALRFAPLTLLAVGFAAAGTLVGLASVLPPGPLFAAAGAATGLIFPSYYVAATGSLGTAPRASALIVAAANVGAILLPAAASLAIALQGAAVMLPFAAAVGLGAALATLVLARRA
jgi:fucose permease